MKQIKIFDTTLRDGQQCPGAGMSLEHNIEYAKMVSKAGIDIIEAGFPAASQTDFNIVNLIAKEITGSDKCSTIAGLCQLRESQIDSTMEALAPAVALGKARLHTYLPIDPVLMQASLGEQANQRDFLINEVYRLINKAYTQGFEVEFSCEGYSRMHHTFDFATDIIRAAISGGATIINCPDTIGGMCRLQKEEYFVNKMQKHADIIKKEFPDKDITWSVHCHNDFGLALENTMEGIFNGPATQIEGCFNGIGERAGNVALEQCIMYIKHFGALPHNKTPFYTQAKTEMLQSISDFVSSHMLPRQPHWPITGDNAAKHSSGGHTNAIISNPLAYQAFDPAEIGKEITFLFGPLSGSNHAKLVIEQQGHICEEHEKVPISRYIKNYYADRRKGITEEELIHAYLQYRQQEK